MAAGHLDATAKKGQFLSHLTHTCTASHDRHKEGSLRTWVDIFPYRPVFLSPLEGVKDRAAPDSVNRSNSFPETLVKRRHLHREIADRAAVEKEPGFRVFFLNALQKAGQNLAQDRDRILCIVKGIYPPVVHGPQKEFIEDGIAQFIFPGKVMEKSTLRDAGCGNDPVEAAALEAVPVEFPVTCLQDLAAGPFGIAQAGHKGKLHTCRNVASSGPEESGPKRGIMDPDVPPGWEGGQILSLRQITHEA